MSRAANSCVFILPRKTQDGATIAQHMMEAMFSEKISASRHANGIVLSSRS